LSLDNEQIVKYINDLDKESKAIKTEALKFSWFMRGGISYDDAMLLSQQERKIIGDIIKSNMETTKESGLPFF
jgi:hypothetical protein